MLPSFFWQYSSAEFRKKKNPLFSSSNLSFFTTLLVNFPFCPFHHHQSGLCFIQFFSHSSKTQISLSLANITSHQNRLLCCWVSVLFFSVLFFPCINTHTLTSLSLCNRQPLLLNSHHLCFILIKVCVPSPSFLLFVFLYLRIRPGRKNQMRKKLRQKKKTP